MRPITRRQVLRGLLLGFASGGTSELLVVCTGAAASICKGKGFPGGNDACDR